MIVLQVLDRGELELEGSRPMTFVDMEDGAKIQIDPRLIKEEYEKEVRGFLDEIKRKCGQFQIDHVLAMTDVPWDTQIREILRRTGAR